MSKNTSRRVSWKVAQMRLHDASSVEVPSRWWWVKEDGINIYYPSGQMTKTQYNEIFRIRKPKFYQTELRLLTDAEVRNNMEGFSIAERMGDSKASCPQCGRNEWWLLPVKSLAVREGGKAYCECLECGYQTHL